MTNFNLIPCSFTIDGVVHPAQNLTCKPALHVAAQRKGFDILGRIFDQYYFIVMRCHKCKGIFRVRLSVMRDDNPLCYACIRARVSAAATVIGAQFTSRDQEFRHAGYFRLNCGHEVRSQFHRIEEAAAGGHAVGCNACREARYATEAQKVGWTLVGSTVDGRTGYRNYRHMCGHEQEVIVGNMFWGDCTCANCGTGWSAAKSFIYLFRIPLPGLVVLKLGYSARPAKRLRHQLGIDSKIETEVLRFVPMPTGNRAVTEERASHNYMRERHPGLVVPKAEFGDGINTLGEIYRNEAIDILNGLMDEITQRYPVD